jgi:hypothetical protein
VRSCWTCSTPATPSSWECTPAFCGFLFSSASEARLRCAGPARCRACTQPPVRVRVRQVGEWGSPRQPEPRQSAPTPGQADRCVGTCGPVSLRAREAAAGRAGSALGPCVARTTTRTRTTAGAARWGGTGTHCAALRRMRFRCSRGTCTAASSFCCRRLAAARLAPRICGCRRPARRAQARGALRGAASSRQNTVSGRTTASPTSIEAPPMALAAHLPSTAAIMRQFVTSMSRFFDAQ